MLRQEIERLSGAKFDAGESICTYRLTGAKLSVAAEHHGLEFNNVHSALADARITAELLKLQLKEAPHTHFRTAMFQFDGDESPKGLTMRRPQAPHREGCLALLATRTAWPRAKQTTEIAYLDALDRCLDDHKLDPAEQHWLDKTARTLNLTENHRRDLHLKYFNLLQKRILSDGIITEEEVHLSDTVAAALQIDRWVHDITKPLEDGSDTVAAALQIDSQLLASSEPLTPVDPPPFRFEPGDVVCFTGQTNIPRTTLETTAKTAGLCIAKSVTLKCAALVAADSLSQSRKARTARVRGVPIITPDDLLRAVT